MSWGSGSAHLVGAADHGALRRLPAKIREVASLPPVESLGSRAQLIASLLACLLPAEPPVRSLWVLVPTPLRSSDPWTGPTNSLISVPPTYLVSVPMTLFAPVPTTSWPRIYRRGV